MEVKVYRKTPEGTTIESHMIPPFVGRSTTFEDEIEGTTTTSDADGVSDVVETVRVGTAVGVTLTRRTISRAGRSWEGKWANGTEDQLIVTPEELTTEVTRVDVDGETVWPQEGGDAEGQPAPAPEPGKPGDAAARAYADAPEDSPEEFGFGLTDEDKGFVDSLIASFA